MLPMKDERVKWADVAKGIGIICVLLGHSGFPFKSFIYSFHMPLFFFLTGYFYNDEYSSKPLIFLKKRMKSLFFRNTRANVIYFLVFL